MNVILKFNQEGYIKSFKSLFVFLKKKGRFYEYERLRRKYGQKSCFVSENIVDRLNRKKLEKVSNGNSSYF